MSPGPWPGRPGRRRDVELGEPRGVRHAANAQDVQPAAAQRQLAQQALGGRGRRGYAAARGRCAQAPATGVRVPARSPPTTGLAGAAVPPVAAHGVPRALLLTTRGQRGPPELRQPGGTPGPLPGGRCHEHAHHITQPVLPVRLLHPVPARRQAAPDAEWTRQDKHVHQEELTYPCAGYCRLFLVNTSLFHRSNPLHIHPLPRAASHRNQCCDWTGHCLLWCGLRPQRLPLAVGEDLCHSRTR